MSTIIGIGSTILNNSSIGVSAPYSASATSFDGTNDYMQIAAETGVDGKLGTLSFWIKFLAVNDGANQYLASSASDKFYIFKNVAGAITIGAKTGPGALVLQLTTTPTYSSADGWMHILSSWDLGNTTSHLYINDAAPALSTQTNTDNTIDYSVPLKTICAANSGSVKTGGCLSEYYSNEAEYIDVSVTENRRKFINADLTPVSLGSDGSTPTGSAPAIYLKDPSTSFETNYGTLANFVVTGALTACSDSP